MMTTKIDSILHIARRECEARLSIVERAHAILIRFPDDILDTIAFSDHWIQICNPSRDQVERILSILHAGKWTKTPSSGWDKLRLDYEGVIDGVTIIIYAAEPPKSCHIVETKVLVPEHEEVRRELVCH